MISNNCNISKRRIDYVDFAKCLAIYLVLWGHALGSLSAQGYSSEVASTTSRWIYSFHMPLFMFLSGIFASSALQKPFLVMLWHKIKQLLWPCITFGFILSFFWYHWEINLDALKHGTLWYGLFYDYWFLHSLLANFIVAWGIYRFPRKYQILMFILIEIFICILFSRGHNISNMATMMPFFIVGIESKHYLPLLLKYKVRVFVGSTIMFGLLFCAYKSDYNSSMYFFNSFTFLKAVEFIYRLAMGALGTISVLSLCMMLEERGRDTGLSDNICKIGGVLYTFMFIRAFCSNVSCHIIANYP